MANPYTRSSLTTWPNGPGNATDNITSLANAAVKGLGSVTVSPLPAADVVVAPIQIMTSSAGVSSTGTASIYLVVSEDNTVWTGGVNPSSSANQATTLTNLLASDTTFGAVQTINVTATSTSYYFREFAVSGVTGPNIPSYVSILIQNNSGATFGSTASQHYATYRTDTYT